MLRCARQAIVEHSASGSLHTVFVQTSDVRVLELLQQRSLHAVFKQTSDARVLEQLQRQDDLLPSFFAT